MLAWCGLGAEYSDDVLDSNNYARSPHTSHLTPRNAIRKQSKTANPP